MEVNEPSERGYLFHDSPLLTVKVIDGVLIFCFYLLNDPELKSRQYLVGGWRTSGKIVNKESAHGQVDSSILMIDFATGDLLSDLTVAKGSDQAVSQRSILGHKSLLEDAEYSLGLFEKLLSRHRRIKILLHENFLTLHIFFGLVVAALHFYFHESAIQLQVSQLDVEHFQIAQSSSVPSFGGPCFILVAVIYFSL